MRTVVMIMAVVCVLSASALATIDVALGDFNAPTYAYSLGLAGQEGWYTTGGVGVYAGWGGGWDAFDEGFVYAGLGSSAKKAFAGSGIAGLQDGTIVSNIAMCEGARNNVIDVTLMTDYAAGTGLKVRLDDTTFPHDFVISYDAGSGYVSSTLPAPYGHGGGGGSAGTLLPWKLEFELDFTSQAVTLWITDIAAGTARAGQTIPFALGTAADLLADGGWKIAKGGTSGALGLDDVIVSNVVPEPVTLMLLLAGAAGVLRKRR